MGHSKNIVQMKSKLNCVSCILTGNTRLELCFNEKLDLAGGKGKYILFLETQDNQRHKGDGVVSEGKWEKVLSKVEGILIHK